MIPKIYNEITINKGNVKEKRERKKKNERKPFYKMCLFFEFPIHHVEKLSQIF